LPILNLLRAERLPCYPTGSPKLRGRSFTWMAASTRSVV